MRLLVFIMILLAAINSHAQTENQYTPLKDQLVPLELNKVRVEGEIGRRIDITMTNNIFLIDIDNDFLASFKTRQSGDYIGLGKLMDAVIKMTSYSNSNKMLQLKKHLVEEIIKAQSADGYIGNKPVEHRMWILWDVHEMGYIIHALINDYRLFGNKEALVAAEKATGYIMNNWSSKPDKWEDMSFVDADVGITGFHRAILTLFKVTNDKRYLDFCLHQLDLKNYNPGIVVGRRRYNLGHVYSYMAASLAQLELYRIFPEEKLLGPTTTALDFMTAGNGMAISGGVGQIETWTYDQDGRGDLGESCATATQVRLYDSMLRLKADSRFGDIMERTIYNALFGAQSPDGRKIRYYTPFEGDREYHNGDTYCCPNNYRRIIAELPSMIYYGTENGAAINLYSQSTAELKLKDGRIINLRQETDYPNSGRVAISVSPAKPALFELKLRIPSWCTDATISINGTALNVACKPGKFAVINRFWKAGDKVLLEMPMKWRLVAGRQRQAGRVAVMRGPMIFTLNPAQNEKLADLDGAELGRLVIDMPAIDPEPVPNNAVRPDGIACSLKAGKSWGGFGNSREFPLILTEFADPDGKCIYFKDHTQSEYVPDELFGKW